MNADLTPGTLPESVRLVPGSGGLPKLEAKAQRGNAEIYFHGGQVTAFKKNGEPPLLFLSERSHFAAGRAIRGGVPICFPWFGPRQGQAAHGFARNADWELTAASTAADGSVQVRLRLPKISAHSDWPEFEASLAITVSDTLALEFIVTNTDLRREFVFENLFHTYFLVADITAISVTGLKGLRYLDQLDGFASKMEQAEAIRFGSEVDRIFLDTPSRLEIEDPVLRRRVRLETSGAASTVVWNPWIEKTRRLTDLGEEDFRRFVCVESGNVSLNKVTLPPGHSSKLKMELSSLTY